MRKLALLAFLALGSAVPLTAQQRAWSGAFAAGYGTGTGSAFSGKGAIWATAAGLLPLSSTVRGGLELGYHRFDTIESRIPEGYGPGTLISEDFTRSMWQLSATMRLRASRHTWRPYFGSGLGAYLVHVRDHMQTQDASGASIPELEFNQTATEIKPGVHVLVGIERAGTLGRAGIGFQIRSDVVVAGGFANVISFGITLALD